MTTQTTDEREAFEKAINKAWIERPSGVGTCYDFFSWGYKAALATRPQMTEDEAVEVMCRAVTKYCIGGSDAMVYLSMEDASSGIKSPNWHRYKHEMRQAYRALLAAQASRGE